VILLVATTNRDKLREIRGLLAHAEVTLASLADVPPLEEPDETGATFEENARLKALYYQQLAAQVPVNEPATGPVLTVAEDSGLEIDALGGEPGIRSARFLRPDASYPERFAEIWRRLAAQPEAPRTARFVCAVAVVHEGRVVFETRGTVEGEITDTPRGGAGFGYDPIFYHPPFGMTLAEVVEEDKLRVAHRGVAFRRLAAWLASGGVQKKTGEP
jgi:XTP/dITP diphosphohydrolase